MSNEFREPKMTQRFFVLIDTAGGKHDEVVEKLKKIPETSEIHTIFGKHDILLVLNVERHFLQESLENGMKLIAGKVAVTPGIKDTDTLTVGKSFIRKKD